MSADDSTATSDKPVGLSRVVELQQQGNVNGSRALLDDRSVSGNVAIRAAAARALGELKAISALPQLAQLLNNDDRVDVRATAALAIGALEDTRGVQPLVAALVDEHDTVRIQVANSLAKLGDDNAAPALLKALDDRSKVVRSAAARALGSIGNVNVLPSLSDIAEKDRLMVRIAAVDAIAQIGGELAIDLLRQLRTRSRNPIFRRYVGVEIKKLNK